MTENPLPIRSDDDVEGHVKRRHADSETSEADDVDGHMKRRSADSETSEGDDVEGHRYM